MMSSPTKAIFLLVLLVSSSSIQLTVALATMAIDLGSEFMKIAIVKPGVPMEIALNVESQRKTAVAVAMRGSERLFGTPAINMAVKFPPNGFLYVPLLVGKKVDNPQVQLYKERFPFHKIQPDENGYVKFILNDKSYTAEELLAMLLENARDTAQKFAEFPIKDAVITVPSFFTQAERRAVLRSAQLIGLNVLQLMNDNAATALNFGIFRRKAFNTTAQYYMIYDMGAASTTASIVSYQMTKQRVAGMVEENPQLTIIGVGIDQTLGGTAFTYRLRDHLAKLFNEQKKSKKDITGDKRAMAKLFKEASRVMKVLSANKECFAQVEGLFDDKDFKAKVTRADFEKLCESLFSRVSGPVDRALEMAQIPLHTIKEILLMGGGTRIPLVQSLLMKVTQKTELGKGINTDEAAALGAVYQAAHHSHGFRVKRFLVKDATYFPIKVDFERLKPGETQKRLVTRTLFSLGKPYPHKMSITFNKHHEDFSFEVGYGALGHLHPDEAKAVGVGNLSTIHLKGVTAAHTKYQGKEGIEAKGVKARFQVDDSGVLSLDLAEALFEKSVEAQKKEASEQSTLSKLGSTISNLFSGSSKEDAKKPEEGEKKDEKKTEEKKSEKKPENAEAKKGSAENKTSAANETTTKKEDLKPITIREVLTFTMERKDMPDPSESLIASSKKLIDDLRNRDLEKKKLERARNELESFIFETKDKLYQEEYEKCSSEEERKKILAALTEAGNWYEEQGDLTPRHDYETRLETLKELMKDIEFRVKEMKERPKVFSALKDLINNTEFFHRSLVNLTGEGKVFTQTEVDTLSKLINETKAWKAQREKELKSAKLTLRPPVLVEDILTKAAALDREVQYLLSKAKYWTPPPTTAPPNTTDSAANATKKEKTEEKGKKEESAKSEPPKTPEKAEEAKQEEKTTPEAEKKTKEPAKEGADKSDEKTPDGKKGHGGEL